LRLLDPGTELDLGLRSGPGRGKKDRQRADRSNGVGQTTQVEDFKFEGPPVDRGTHRKDKTTLDHLVGSGELLKVLERTGEPQAIREPHVRDRVRQEEELREEEEEDDLTLSEKESESFRLGLGSRRRTELVDSRYQDHNDDGDGDENDDTVDEDTIEEDEGEGDTVDEDEDESGFSSLRALVPISGSSCLPTSLSSIPRTILATVSPTHRVVIPSVLERSKDDKRCSATPGFHQLE
jgi:hypothetical protein